MGINPARHPTCDCTLSCPALSNQTPTIAGRLSLLEVAAWFRAAGLGTTVAECLPAVIGWTHLALGDRPEQAETVSGRLEWELEHYLGRFGHGRLPVSP